MKDSEIDALERFYKCSQCRQVKRPEEGRIVIINQPCCTIKQGLIIDIETNERGIAWLCYECITKKFPS